MKTLLMIAVAMIFVNCNRDLTMPDTKDMGTIESVSPVYSSEGTFDDLQINLSNDTILVLLTDVQEIVSDTEWKLTFQENKHHIIDDGYGNACIDVSKKCLKFKRVKNIQINL